MEPEFGNDTEALLAQAGWMRGLALSVLGDPAAADDVVQDATVAALLHGPSGDVGLERWLSRVVRNFAFRRRRAKTRRAEHEARATPPSREPTPAETAERLDLQRTLVEAVLAIEEPLRTTMVLRYFENRSSAEIARLQRVPAGTVRWRLKRGIEVLRERLDARTGSREDWVALIAPIAWRPVGIATGSGALATGSKLLTGVLAMKAAQLAATAAALVIVGGIAWWSLGGSRDSIELTVAAATPPSAAAAGVADLDPTTIGERESAADAGAARASVAPSTANSPQPEVPAAQPDERVANVDARFIDEHGAPWSGVRLAPREVRWLANWKPGEGVLSDADGRAALRIVLPPTRLGRAPIGEVKLEFVASRAGCTTARCATTLRAGETSHLGDVVLGAGVRILGRALDESGKGVALAAIGVAPAELTEDEGHMRRHGSDTFSDVPGTHSSAGGAFVVDGVTPGAALRIWAHAEGKRYAWSAPIQVPNYHDLLGFEIVLTSLLDTDRIVGQVIGPDDAPIADASIWLLEHSRGSGMGTSMDVDAHGRFDLLVQHDDSTYDFTAEDMRSRYATTTVEGVRPGSLDVVIRLVEKRFFALHVRDTEGGPVAGAKFQISARGMAHDEPSTIATPGDYSIALPNDKFDLEVTASGFHSRGLHKLDAATLPAVMDVVMQRAPVIHGRVVANGTPVAGARVNLQRDSVGATLTIAGYRARYIVQHGGTETVSDAQGQFRLDCDEDHGFWLRATAEGWAPGEVGPLDATQLRAENEIDIEITKGGAIEGNVISRDGRDGEGTILSLNHGDGAPRTIRAGPKGLFRVDGLAPGKWQVLQAESEIDPASTTYSSTRTVAPIEWSCEVSAGRTAHFDLDLSKP